MIPGSAVLQADYGDVLMQLGRNRDAITPLRKAYTLQPDNMRFQVLLAEAELLVGHKGEAIKLATVVQDRMKNGEQASPNIRNRIDGLMSRVGEPQGDKPATPPPGR